MDTIIVSGHSSHKRERYRHHTQAFKLSVVQASLQPGASVSRVARQHNINANQLFTWRKAYREGGLCDAEFTALLPVRMEEAISDGDPVATTSRAPVTSGRIELVRNGTTLRIDGRADPDTLRAILAHWP